MSKMLKVVAMLLVIAAVVFAAGCSSNKAPAAENKTTPAAPAVTNESAVAPAANTTTEVMPAENNTSAIAPAVNTTSEVMPAENNTSTSAAGAANMGKAARNKALIESHQSNVTTNSTANTT